MSEPDRARQLLDPAVVARLGTLELKSADHRRGFPVRSAPQSVQGFSVEFTEYASIHGDDLSTIDWKVYARSDRYYVKKFEEETNLDCHLMLDVSGSMGYGSSGLTKLEYGSVLAASIGVVDDASARRRGSDGVRRSDRRTSCSEQGARPEHPRALCSSCWIVCDSAGKRTCRSPCTSSPTRSPSGASSC